MCLDSLLVLPLLGILGCARPPTGETPDTAHSDDTAADTATHDGPGTRWIDVAVGGLGSFYDNAWSCGLANTGEVYCWGRPAAPPLLFADLPDGPTAGRTIHTLYDSACIHSSDAALECWGSVDASTLPQMPLHSVDSMLRHHGLCGIDASGEVRCGADPSWYEHEAPTGPFVDVSTAYQHRCARSMDRSVQCWGRALGPWRPWDAIPAGVSVLAYGVWPSGICYIDAQDGQIHCSSAYDDPIGSPPTPLSYTDIFMGHTDACAIRSDNQTICWGQNMWTVSSPDAELVKVAVFSTHACGITVDGDLLCWGTEENGAELQVPVLE